MKTRFVCLANSHKEGGRCVAGIEIDDNNHPVLLGGHPKWVRPVCNHTPHGEIPTHLVSALNLLDIVEIEFLEKQTSNYQTENYFFKENAIAINGSFDKSKLIYLCDNRSSIFNSKGKALSEEYINKLNHSLMFIKTNQFSVLKKTYEDTPGKIQCRLIFNYNESEYDFPITDPAFLQQFQREEEFYKKHNEVFLTLSLGIKWQDWYYKLVAGLIWN